jgi:hypothetical protein
LPRENLFRKLFYRGWLGKRGFLGGQSMKTLKYYAFTAAAVVLVLAVSGCTLSP